MNANTDAVVVGAGPNGLAAAIRLAQAGISVTVLEANETIGGGARTAELTLPGFRHDVCSAIHPMAAASPFLRTLPLERFGLEWVHPGLPLAHPLDGGVAATLSRSLDETVEGLGTDGASYRRLVGTFADRWQTLAPEILQPMVHLPRRPLALTRFGLSAIRPARSLARSAFKTEIARALFAGAAAHSFLSLDAPASSAIGIVLAAAAHVAGWPMPRGGTQALTDAMAACLEDLGGTIQTNRRVTDLGELDSARAILLDLTPRQILALKNNRLSSRYQRKLSRYRYGPAAFKLDYALDAEIPWSAEACRRAGTIHIGGTLDEVAESEDAMARGRIPGRPFVLLAQPTVFDPSRAPDGKHIVWAYCHVPNGCEVDVSDRIENQIERFAPGFRDRVLARTATSPAEMEEKNANIVGGDIAGGSSDLVQILARPVLHPVPYRTPTRGLYVCSSSTPPGAGVHGMCGFHAAEAVLSDLFR